MPLSKVKTKKQQSRLKTRQESWDRKDAQAKKETKRPGSNRK